MGKPFSVEQEKRKYQKHQGVKSSQVRKVPSVFLGACFALMCWLETPACLLTASQAEQTEHRELIFLSMRWFFEEGKREQHRGFDADGAT